MQLKNIVLLNSATDGVSVEVKSNLKVLTNYLKGLVSHLAISDTNHNVKNSRYQLIGGSGKNAASIGCYVFDPFLLSKATGIPKE